MRVLYLAGGRCQGVSEKETDFLGLRTLDPASHKPRKDQGERGSDEVGKDLGHALLRRTATDMAMKRMKALNQYHDTSIR